MQFLSGYAHFAAETELAAVGEPGGRVDVYRGAVDKAGKERCALRRRGDYAVAVTRRMSQNVRHRPVDAVDYADSQLVVKKFPVKVAIARRRRTASAADERGCAVIEQQPDLVLRPFGDEGIVQAGQMKI